MNRFDYFSDIEDTFVRLRGKALYISPLDWELIAQWKADGVPLHIVIAAIEECFARQKGKEERGISSLRYCKPAVERTFQDWKAARVGAHESEPGAVATGSNNPFPKDEVESYLKGRQDDLLHARDAREAMVECAAEFDGLIIALTKAYELLLVLWKHFEDKPDARKLEDELTTIERDLDAAIEAVATPEQIAEARAAAEALYEPYKDRMPEKIYEQQIVAALKKRLREIFGVPRLSLFHMGAN